ncbi:bifunctional D-glycero-beta-D-manno-heptose-7-phosphate kinase/D-glycero-beta-D-manno-heptose 1-phosphate adenylyltransferase HldE [Blochmannia endosymbiont of Polyrhachis (Hedomyrma) turneri]|uniref:bifunctional D-glycero-beta-D-manno-heptose-7-phosphate kinase/D-glycero-beta-D-manno-heptose 1-phosphate adenylyltransferase HldE n=1 Tax=Blochmannia endosymbiont of Polyrhachis (Hedomyrma) turneri TaxID=1505596 RepID=UPI00061A6D7D|nr:bifunctional D-glycero-beta-D-manno-heptose-7-phosphate kinase/D-glycero-beta-D-manno-heptose 1-phosphate adenylyltransferase HldE [Blochmannia endosymbiont of Polyrhachis (Hedomyrma) turneri]AKC59654.1 bifunctional protein hldE [Blochmannia endosymbiont of Polyrhachis (Hedomyrma) turneri]
MNFIFPDFSQSRVLVIGDVMLDRYYFGDTPRISSEAPVVVVNVDRIEECPGGAANVAMNVAALGAKVKLISVVGVDDTSKILARKLSLFNVDYSFIYNDNYLTTIKLRVLSHHQQLIRLDFEKKFRNSDILSFIEYIKLALLSVNVLVISDYAKGLLNGCLEDIIAIAHEFSVPVIVDPKGSDFSKYSGATLLTPNLLEFEHALGCCYNREDVLITRGMEIILQCRLSAMLITRSENGMLLLQRGREPLYFSARAKKVYNVTGAGDTVIATLAASMSVGKSLEEACFLANVAAGLVVEKSGTSVINLSELKSVINGHVDIVFGVLSEDDLLRNVDLARQRGEKIVMTNGVFDILHSGHVTYLSKAKRLGDRLIVAVNSDSSTKRLKGINRPINSLEKRMVVLSALSVVDWVVSFNEDSPKRLIGSLLPDVLVKGGDYQFCEIDGSQEVMANGGQVYTLDFELNCSSSKMIDVLQQSKDK